MRTLQRAFRRRPTFFAFYVGRGDTRFRAENFRLHRELLAAGVPHLFRLYPGAHAQTVWSAHAGAWLRLVLAHLSAEQAASLLSWLPLDVQSDVAHRIAVMERPSPDVVRNVEEVLANKLANYTEHSSGDTLAGGVVPLVNILNRSNPTTGMAILERLEQTDVDLADEVRRRMFVFEDIVTLDDRTVQLVLREVDTKHLAVALKGTANEVRQKVMGNLSERAAGNLAEEIDLLGPVRLRDVEEARDNVVKVIRALEEAGQIVVSRSADEFVE